jgi:alkanesulfonate monooxygenase SsuD/methylene tetrahydromethanopterin reductase-like flavin-dependent oxidoreductase (luciferase family)
MQFGLNFFPCVGPDEKSAEQYFREAMHLCGLTDELGYTHIRQVEHYFHPYGGYSPNPLLFLTAAAMVTKKTRLITGAVLPAFNKPLKLAGEIGMLDGISNGRLESALPAPSCRTSSRSSASASTRAAAASPRGSRRSPCC